MKLISIPFILASFLSGCSGNSASKDNKDASSGSGNELAATSPGDASFSVSIDGTPVAGSGTGELQLQNAAFIYPPKNNGPQTVLFDLLSAKKGDDFYSIRFSLPDKEGEYHATQGTYNQSYTSVTLDFNLRSSNNFSRYDEDSITVVANKITSSRISGTFSGVLRLSADTRSQAYKDKVTVSDGKFDIPFSTGNLRPE
ncbi:MAG TPA: hypothetical protein VGI82_09330 [Chitinophagaceae bacterium]|jgi:hypothetical protein